MLVGKQNTQHVTTRLGDLHSGGLPDWRMFAISFGEGVHMTELNQALAEAVREWATRNALSQTVIAARGGPSTTSMTKILSGSGSVRPGSLTDLDKGLGWGQGVAVEYLAGRDPLGLFAASNSPVTEWTNEQLLAELARRLAQTDTNRSEGDGTNDKSSAAQQKIGNSPDAGTQPVDIQDILRQSHGGFRRAAANKGELIDDREAEAEPDDFNQDPGE